MITFEKPQVEAENTRCMGVGEARALAGLGPALAQGDPKSSALQAPPASVPWSLTQAALEQSGCWVFVVYISLCVCTGMCTHMWRPEVKLGCLLQSSETFLLKQGFPLLTRNGSFGQAKWPVHSSNEQLVSASSVLGFLAQTQILMFILRN